MSGLSTPPSLQERHKPFFGTPRKAAKLADLHQSGQDRFYPHNFSTLDVFAREASSSLPPPPSLIGSSPSNSPTSSSFSKSSLPKRSLSRSVMAAFVNNRSPRPSVQSERAASLSQPQDIQLVPLGSTSSASFASSSSYGIQARKNSDPISQFPRGPDAASTVRHVGRGGQGSRPRAFSTSAFLPTNMTDPEPYDTGVANTSTEIIRGPSSTHSEHDKPIVRVVGRGGSGSRPRPAPVAGKTPIPLSNLSEQAVQNEPLKTFRIPGRGGAGSRPRSKTADGSTKTKLDTKLTSEPKSKGKARWKGKARMPFKPRRPPSPKLPPLPIDPPLPTPHEIVLIHSNDSTSTLSAIHFADDSRPASTFISSQISTPPDGLSLSSTITSSISTTFDGLPLTPVTSAGNEFPDTPDSPHMSEFNPSPEVIRERSTNKLARTLGDLPPEAIYERLLKERQKNFDSLPRIVTSNLAANDRTLRISRRASLTSFGSFSSFLLPSSRRRDVSSQHSVSTLTDDVHQFGLTDDLSESWGEMRDDSSRAGFRAESPTSPIVFSPPTPVANAPPAGTLNTPSATSFSSTAPSSEDAENLSLPSPSLNRSHSYSHSSRKRGERTHIHSASVPRRPDTPFDMYTLPVKSNWMNPSPTVEQDEETTPVTTKAPELVEGNGWRGEWNRTNMQDVIKTLRSLK